MKEVLMSWSGGKDSCCLALYEIQKSTDYSIAALFTTVTRDYDRISMHGVRRVLLERQAESLGLPLHQVLISKGANNQEYEAKMAEAFGDYRRNGIDSIILGDLFLEDIRAYRDRFLTKHKMQGLYPVWQRNTTDFIKDLLNWDFWQTTFTNMANSLRHYRSSRSLRIHTGEHRFITPVLNSASIRASRTGA